MRRNKPGRRPKQNPKNLSEIARRAGLATIKSIWLNDPHRPQPSLPRVKWRERPDP